MSKRSKRLRKQADNQLLQEAIARYAAKSHKCKICGKTCARKYDLCLDCFQDYKMRVKRVHSDEISATTEKSVENSNAE